MTESGDDIGDLLRRFYSTFGMPNEGPTEDLNVEAIIGGSLPDADLNVLRTALADEIACRQLRDCRDVLDDVATRLTGDEFLQELCGIPMPDRGLEQLSSGVFWFALASSLDSRDADGLPVLPPGLDMDIPLPVRVQLTMYGSLVLRLYIALVYMREGLLADLIRESSRAGGRCSSRVEKLLNCDFVRRVRNALSHGTFSTCAAGIVFQDDRGSVVATPGFLNWLCTWLNLIQLQAMSAGTRSPHVA